MTNWPNSWRENALRAAGVEPADFALNIMHLWEQSTPTDRWTNNPLGMPSEGYAAPRALRSPYAAFPTMVAFDKAFALAAHRGHGEPLYTLLGTSDSHAEAWRVIHGLEWPANGTETDYPVKLLDRIEDKIRESMPIKTPGERKTIGLEPATRNVSTSIRAQAEALHHAASNFNSAPLAIRYIAQKLGRNG